MNPIDIHARETIPCYRQQNVHSNFQIIIVLPFIFYMIKYHKPE